MCQLTGSTGDRQSQPESHRKVTLLASIILILILASRTLADAPPNVVIVFADDLGYGDVGCFNSNCPFQTPNLDEMASQGARLTNFYVPTPYCAPSRGTLLTGRYPFRHSVVRNPAPDAGASNFGLPQSEVTLAELLKASGYATAAYGKWHLGHKAQWLPRTQGFDEYFGILYSNDMFPVQLVHNESVLEYPVVQATLTARYTERAIQFIERHRDQPFFLYLPHAMPHKPLAASDNFYTRETLGDLYADVIRELDHSVGQLLEKLRELELDKKTLVVFTSDNGPWYGGSTGGLRGMKGKTWEGGLRVPMIATLPGTIPAGLSSDVPAATIDLLPTICKLANVTLPNDRTIDGRDIMPILDGSSDVPPHDAIFGMQGTELATLRSGKWKLHVRSPGPKRFSGRSPEELANWVDPRRPDGVTLLAPYEQPMPNEHPGLTGGDAPKPMMLFDLGTDPGEQHDVSSQHPDVVEALLAKFNSMQQQVPDFEQPESDYLFAPPKQGNRRELMRLIGGELRYDRIPATQKHLLAKPAVEAE